MKPILTLSHKSGQLQVRWVKGNEADAIRIDVDRGDGKGFQFLTIDNHPNYTDLAAMTHRGTWKYRAVYVKSDKLIGKWSDEVCITI